MSYGDRGPGGSSGEAGAAMGGAGPGGPGGYGFGNGGGYGGASNNLGATLGGGEGGYNGYGADDGPDSAYGGLNTGPMSGSMGSMGDGGFSDFGFGLDSGLDSFGYSNFAAPDATASLSSMFGEAPTANEYGFVDSGDENDRMKKMAAGILGSVVGQALPGPLGAFAANTAATASGVQTQGQMAKNLTTGIFGGLGSVLGGPLGGLVGNLLGRSVTANGPTGPVQGRTGMEGGRTELDLGGIAGSLAGLYQANKASKDGRNAANAMTTGVQTQLNDMFGPNSAYAQQLRQELSRKDAAAGRRSQYGPREVELQAKLAEMQSRAMPGIINANTSASTAALNAQNARRAQQNAMYNNLLQLGQKSGAFGAAQRGLSGLFGGGSQPATTDVFGDGVWG